MKYIMIIASILAGLSINATAIVVSVSNVVVASQGEEARTNYVGRTGELVRNRGNKSAPLTVFDGIVEGGIPLAASKENTYNVFLTTNETLNGQMVIDAFEWANNYPVVGSGTTLYVDVYQGEGSYTCDLDGQTITNTRNKVNLRGINGNRIKTTIHDRAGNYFGAANIVLESTNDIFYTAVTLVEDSYDGIYFKGDITVGIATEFKNCQFDNDIFSSTTIPNCYFQECRFNGQIYSGLPNGLSGRFQNCFFDEGSTLPSLFGPTASWDNTLLDNVWSKTTNGFCGGTSARSGYSAKLFDCKIDAENMFFAGNAGLCKVVARDCEFTGHTSDWILNNLSEFWNCKGLDTSITGTVDTIIGCTDENGNVIPNKAQ